MNRPGAWLFAALFASSILSGTLAFVLVDERAPEITADPAATARRAPVVLKATSPGWSRPRDRIVTPVRQPKIEVPEPDRTDPWTGEDLTPTLRVATRQRPDVDRHDPYDPTIVYPSGPGLLDIPFDYGDPWAGGLHPSAVAAADRR